MQTILSRFNWTSGSVACRRRRRVASCNHVIKLASCYMTTTTTTLSGTGNKVTAEGTGKVKDKRTSSDIVLGRHVREALANGQPVVALESTVITHGLPEPKNLELALELEREVRDNHRAPGVTAVTPATVGIIKGQLIVGLSRDEIEYLAQIRLSKPIKASRRDLALAQAYGLSAGTTVSATMALASSCCATSGGRIHVFATGGMGGVHLRGEQSMDVSADLMEMSRSPMGVVASGFKSFLDTRRSLEYLETMGCTVASLRELCQATPEVVVDHSDRKSQMFPGFFSEINRERVRSPWQCQSIQEAARILYYCTNNNKLRNQRAMLLACPIPQEFSLDNQEYAQLMDQVVSEVEGRAGSGQEKTPLILAELARRTQGRTLEANLALLRNNACIGAHLAHEHALLLEPSGAPSSLRGSQGQWRCVQPEGTNQRCVIAEIGGSDKRDITSAAAAVETASKKPLAPEVDNSNDGDATTTTTTTSPARRRPIVIGCTMIDMHVRTKIDAQFKENPHYSGVTFAGHPHLTLGGVGRNLAAGLQLLGHSPLFVTSLARDALGEFALNEMHKIGFKLSDGQNDDDDDDDSLKVLHAPQSMSSPFALVLMDSLTGQCEYVIANLEAARVISRENLAHLLERQITGKEDEPPTLVVTDANLPAHTLDHIIDLCATHAVPLFLEPTDVACLPRLVGALKLSQLRNHHHQIALMSPNVVELEQMLRLFQQADKETNEQHAHAEVSTTIPEVQILAAELMQRHLPSLRCLLVTMDKRGVLVGVRLDSTDGATGGAELDHLNIMKLAATTQIINHSESNQDTTTWTFKHYPPHQLIERPISGSGAGDCFASGFISGLLLELTLGDCVSRGFQAARCALLDRCTVPETLRKLAIQV